MDIDAVIPEKAKTPDRILYNVILVRGVQNADEILADADIKRKEQKLNEIFDPIDPYFVLKKHGRNIVLEMTEIESSVIQFLKEEFGVREKAALKELTHLVRRSADVEPSASKPKISEKPKGFIAEIVGAKGDDGAVQKLSGKQREAMFRRGEKGGDWFSKN